MSLSDLGWDNDFQQGFDPFDGQGFVPARITREERAGYLVHTADHEEMAVLAGRLRHELELREDRIAVGDWVAIRQESQGQSLIQGLIPRRTWISRQAAGGRSQEQILAANVDVVFLVTSLDANYSLRRLERYLTLAWDTGAQPVLVLNKIDICDSLEQRLAEVTELAGAAPCCATCAINGRGVDALASYLESGRTGVFLGSSGVGKSTLINDLLGHERQATQPVRETDSRGRHTTTHRELILLPGGGVLIDTPGMRELQPWASEEATRQTFHEIDELAASCRFHDCRHDQEPGCAVQAALADGDLEPDRLASYHKQQRELRHLASRHDERLRRSRKADEKREQRHRRRYGRRDQQDD